MQQKMKEKIIATVHKIFKDNLRSLCFYIEYHHLYPEIVEDLDKKKAKQIVPKIQESLDINKNLIGTRRYNALDCASKQTVKTELNKFLDDSINDASTTAITALIFDKEKEEKLDNLISKHNLQDILPKKYDGRADREIIKATKIAGVYNKMDLFPTTEAIEDKKSILEALFMTDISRYHSIWCLINQLQELEPDKKRILELLFMTSGSSSSSFKKLNPHAQFDLFKDIKINSYQYEAHRLHRIRFIKLAFLLEWDVEQTDELLEIVSPEGGWHLRDHVEYIFYVFMDQHKDMKETQNLLPADLFREALWKTYEWKPEYNDEKNQQFPNDFNQNADDTWTNRIRNLSRKKFSSVKEFEEFYNSMNAKGCFGTYNNTLLYQFMERMWKTISGDTKDPDWRDIEGETELDSFVMEGFINALYANLEKSNQLPKINDDAKSELSTFDEKKKNSNDEEEEDSNDEEKKDSKYSLVSKKFNNDPSIILEEEWRNINKDEKEKSTSYYDEERTFNLALAEFLKNNQYYNCEDNPFFGIDDTVWTNLKSMNQNHSDQKMPHLSSKDIFTLINLDPDHAWQYIKIFKFINDYQEVIRVLISPILNVESWSNLRVTRPLLIFAELFKHQFGYCIDKSSKNNPDQLLKIEEVQEIYPEIEMSINALKKADEKSLKEIERNITTKAKGTIDLATVRHSIMAYMYWKLARQSINLKNTTKGWEYLNNSLTELFNSMNQICPTNIMKDRIKIANTLSEYVCTFSEKDEKQRATFLSNLMIFYEEAEEKNDYYWLICDKLISLKNNNMQLKTELIKGRADFMISELNDALPNAGYSKIDPTHNIYDIPLDYLTCGTDYISAFIEGYHIVQEEVKKILK